MSRILVRSLFCLLLIAPLCRADGPRSGTARPKAEPTYAGRGLRAWTAMLDDSQPVRRLAAAKALGAMGPDAAPSIPELTRALEDRESWVRTEAAMALGEIGPAAVDSAPAMLAALRRAGYFQGGLIGPSLAKLGPGVVPLLIQATHERGGNTRWEAVRALRLIGPDAREAADRLAELTRDPEGSLRIEAAFALWTIARRPEAISVLAEALTDPNEYVQGTAADHLGTIGPEAKSAVPALIRALGDEKAGAGNPAANALGKIGPAAVDAVPAILRIAGAASPTMLSLAYPAADIGPDAVPALIAGLDDPADGPRWTAAAALGRIGPHAQAAVPRLTRMSTSEQSGDRLAAAVALWRITRDPRVVPNLAEIVRPAVEGGERYAALEALGEIGPAATEAVPALIHQLGVVSETNANKVVEVLGRIGPGGAEAVAPLERISADAKDDSLRATANLALWRITRGEKGVAALVKELQGRSRLARTSALSALGQIGPGAAPAVPAIAELLEDDEEFSILSNVIGSLGKIGPPARSTLPALIQIFNDVALFDKSRVGHAIRSIDPETAASLGIR